MHSGEQNMQFNMQKEININLERTHQTLIMRITQANAQCTVPVFIQQQGNLALEALEQNCNWGRVLTALLNIGLRSDPNEASTNKYRNCRYQQKVEASGSFILFFKHMSTAVKASIGQQLLNAVMGVDAMLLSGSSQQNISGCCS